LRAREGAAPRLLRRHAHLDLRERQRETPKILEQPTARRSGGGDPIGTPRSVDTARVGVTQQEDRACRVDQPHVFHRVAFVLPALTARLCSRVLGTYDGPFGAIVATRGAAGTGVGAAGGSVGGVGGSGVGTTPAAASASATPSRVANSGTDRVGVSPSRRRVAPRTPTRTCSHGWALRWPIPNSRPWTTCRA
jgi:hypothetical protein